jgi:hypothetical protein
MPMAVSMAAHGGHDVDDAPTQRKRARLTPHEELAALLREHDALIARIAQNRAITLGRPPPTPAWPRRSTLRSSWLSVSIRRNICRACSSCSASPRSGARSVS